MDWPEGWSMAELRRWRLEECLCHLFFITFFAGSPSRFRQRRRSELGFTRSGQRRTTSLPTPGYRYATNHYAFR